MIRLMMMGTVLLASVALAVTPVPASPPGFTPFAINAGPGDQHDPHVSGNFAAYTSDLTIRYYNFATSTDAAITPVANSRDQLSDISGSKVAFSRIGPGKTAVMVFDAVLGTANEIDPTAGSLRLGSAIGGNTVAFVDFIRSPNGQLVAYDLATGVSTPLATNGGTVGSPAVSPDGNVVTWEECPSTCEIRQAVKTGDLWAASVAVTAPANNPDTNGSLLVYDAAAGSGSDIFWKPVSGGTAVALQLAGFERNPSIAGDYVAFEAGPTVGSPNDLFLYNITTNRLYQITATALINEQLNDITVLADGRIRLVWASDEDGQTARNVSAAEINFGPVGGGTGGGAGGGTGGAASGQGGAGGGTAGGSGGGCSGHGHHHGHGHGHHQHGNGHGYGHDRHGDCDQDDDDDDDGHGHGHGNGNGNGHGHHGGGNHDDDDDDDDDGHHGGSGNHDDDDDDDDGHHGGGNHGSREDDLKSATPEATATPMGCSSSSGEASFAVVLLLAFWVVTSRRSLVAAKSRR